MLLSIYIEDGNKLNAVVKTQRLFLCHRSVGNVANYVRPASMWFYMWKRLNKDSVIREEDGVTHIFDELNLRKSLRSYLSDESRNRFGGDNFSTDKCFLKGIQWHLDGLKLFYESL